MSEPSQTRDTAPDAQLERTPEELLRIIFDYTAKISGERSLKNVLLLMADMGREMILADRCTVWLIDRANQELFTTIAHGVNEIRIPLGSGFAGHSMATGESLLIDDAYADPRHNAESDLRTGYRTQAVITVPFLGNDGTMIGAYQAINKLTPQAVFTQRDLEQLKLAAAYAGKSLESVMLHEEIESTQREIIYTMGQIGESRSKETGNHVKRVAEYSAILALGLGLSAEEAELLRVVSPMHDIGKVAVPDAVLLKPGKLTPEEFDQMKLHTEVGYHLLKSSSRELLQTAAIVAHQHHEKWNGTGYPQGLKEDEIHLYGRITAVADVFDALGSERIYKEAWDLDRILALFREERGRHFDPRVVDAFMEQLPVLLDIRERFRDDLAAT
ncbi:HD domain-containing phosphohydrolase [Paenibacillus sacheonensis]|uniref:HD domain-containing protein n=1 Tax=Paenibacillus sacheonensis TaxID=742054 RepID=A0A7X4YQB9_9BACL|nr:HD domain-containing phosphohydrolase [Paenibacillus sacheonensis]MBM7565443.1 HD-GYP domain-containing protein (c-di-GMP phosphodiesterase class II) [Paenibacillus sacheonensis]NBC69629.1 HD domain-containing protein [Paenibacillus sacheonensis]